MPISGCVSDSPSAPEAPSRKTHSCGAILASKLQARLHISSPPRSRHKKAPRNSPWQAMRDWPARDGDREREKAGRQSQKRSSGNENPWPALHINTRVSLKFLKCRHHPTATQSLHPDVTNPPRSVPQRTCRVPEVTTAAGGPRVVTRPARSLPQHRPPQLRVTITVTLAALPPLPGPRGRAADAGAQRA